MRNEETKLARLAPETHSRSSFDIRRSPPGWLIFIGIAILALAIRLPRLSQRPMHTDEAVNAYIIGGLLGGEPFRYDPQDRHGPTLYASTLPIVRAAGARTFSGLNETMLRLEPVIVGSLAVLLFALLAQEVGMTAAAVAALFWAIAPLPVYYSRYFIHETLFVAATLGFILFGLRAIQSGRGAQAILAGAFAALMLASKETAFINFAAIGAAMARHFFPRKRRDSAPGEMIQTQTVPSAARITLLNTALLAAGVFLVIVIALYSWGGRHWSGPIDLIHSIPHFVSRASGEGHQKPWWYYFALLGGGWSGAPVLALALVGVMSTVKKTSGRCGATLKFWLGYAILVSIFYSAIPYKTPWLALNLWLPVSILAGIGFSKILNLAKLVSVRVVIFSAALLLVALLARDTELRVFLKPADEKNPYAYAHTVEDLPGLPARIAELARRKNLAKPAVAVVAADPWPLPWYLRKFRAGFWQPDQTPGAADFYVTSPEAAEKLGGKLNGWRPEFFGIRPEAVVILWTPPEKKS